MKTLITLATATAFAVIGAIGFAYSGLYDVSASSPHSGLVNWLLSTTSHASIERHASAVTVPDLSDDALVRAGINDFDAMCARCHGAPGQPLEAMAQGLNPAAPDLATSAAHMDPAELFWVTKHGIKMTGMPAWGTTHDDDALWPVVAFMTKLPYIDTDSYRALLTSAEGMGHHAPDDEQTSHGHGDADAAAMADDHVPATPTASTDDATRIAGPDEHSTHNHDTPTPEKDEKPHDDKSDHHH